MGVIDDLRNAAVNSLNVIANSITNMINRVKNAIGDMVNSIRNTLSNIVREIVDTFERVFNSIANTLNNIFNSVLNRISNFINDMTDYIGNLIDRTITFISNLVSDAGSYLSGVFDNIVSNIDVLFNSTLNLFSDIARDVSDSISNIVDRAIDFVSDIFSTVKSGVATIINSANDIVMSLARGIDDFIRSVVDVIGNSLQSLLETIADLPGEISALADSLIKSAQENIGEPLKELPLKAITAIAEAIGGEPVKQADKMQLDLLNLVFGQSPVIRSPETMRQAIADFMPENDMLKTLIIALVSPLILLQTMSGVASANSQILLQEHALVNPYRLIEPGDVIRARHFDLISEEDAADELRKTGYTQSAADTLLQIGENVPPAGELVSWLLRGLISEEEFNRGLARSGWNEEDTAKLRQAAFFIPPVNDLITMAVREVFTPDIAARFGQFEDFPPEFVKQAAKQGVNEEWAKRYWGAHWALPSVQMGFEMLHRDVISQEDLALLMRASDIMPFWRDKLIEISFSPLTRVDIRRMHKVGVLTEKEVNRAYHDIGYNDINAIRLTEFTLALNGEEPIENDVELSSLSRTNIIGFFTDGIITQQDAVDLLEQAGIDKASSELFVAAAALDIDRQERKDAITIVINQAKSGSLSFDQAQDTLNSLGLEEAEIQKAINDLNKIESTRNKLPSKADLDKMLTVNIIQDSIYRETMALIGYNSTWTERYLKLLESKQNAA